MQGQGVDISIVCLSYILISQCSMNVDVALQEGIVHDCSFSCVFQGETEINRLQGQETRMLPTSPMNEPLPSITCTLPLSHSATYIDTFSAWCQDLNRQPTSIASTGTRSPMTAASISFSGCTLPPPLLDPLAILESYRSFCVLGIADSASSE